MARTTNLGFPRIGPQRELKRAVESYWRGELDETGLHQAAAAIRKANWELQRSAGIDLIPSNDFSFYDQVLDMTMVVGAVPERFQGVDEPGSLGLMFAMARGASGGEGGVRPMEMTKWFDTNYHYIVPEIGPDTAFSLASRKPVDEFAEALALGIQTKPVLLGPLTYLLLAKARVAGARGGSAETFRPLDRLPDLLPVYGELIRLLREEGAEWIQLDEPCLALDRSPIELQQYEEAYAYLRSAAGCGVKLFLATYFEGLRENLQTALRLPVDALHIDLVRAPEQLDAVLEAGLRPDQALSLGVVDGRNVWRNDLEASLALLERAKDVLGHERIIVGPSCSLLHVPVDLEAEKGLDDGLRSSLAFARQKIDEIVCLGRGLAEGRRAVAEELAASRRALEARRRSADVHRPEVKARAAAVEAGWLERKSPFEVRKRLQQERLRLPALPTTTIGSFPQTPEVRAMRARLRRGEVDGETYGAFVREEIRKAIRLQEEVGLDVLVHGEFERNDMVEFFGEKLAGFAFTSNGWVQSYGTRCVKPPIIYGDVERPEPMTVDVAVYAASLTQKPVKGMLTGPVTILQWSFVRDDQPREETCRQIALAIRDEVKDLEAAGLPIIQIDEPALREGLPLRRADQAAYLRWAVDSFRLAANAAADVTQIHTHMCYADFHEIMEAIAAMDADVVSLEASRSEMELLGAFRDFKYPNDIGPGVYDIHSPRVPPVEEMVRLIERALETLDPDQLWVNPDCGLKTRSYEEVRPALAHMVEAAKAVRSKLEAGARQPS